MTVNTSSDMSSFVHLSVIIHLFLRRENSLVLGPGAALGVRYLTPRSTGAKIQHFLNFQLGLWALRIVQHTRPYNAMNYLQQQQPRLAMLARQIAIGRRRILDSGGSALAARCYATTKRTKTKAATAPKTSKPRATVTNTTSSGGKAAVSGGIAAATPLRKPSTSGLGVPSRSPAASPASSPPVSSSIPTSTTPGAATTDDGSALAAAREETLRTARLRRIDREKEAARQEEKERDYKERYDGAAKRYKLVVTALPILLVTSYFLFQQCEYIPARYSGIPWPWVY